MQTVVTHITVRRGLDPIDAGGMTVLGAFVVNAPSFYLYDGQFDCFTLNGLENLLRHGKGPVTLNIDVGEETVLVPRPYFKNALRNSGSS